MSKSLQRKRSKSLDKTYHITVPPTNAKSTKYFCMLLDSIIEPCVLSNLMSLMYKPTLTACQNMVVLVNLGIYNYNFDFIINFN